jgi:hypothetical protein
MARSVDLNDAVALSIDTGGSNVRTFLVSLANGIIGYRTFKLSDMGSKDQLGETTIGLFHEMLTEKDIGAGRVVGVGHGSAGVPDEKNFLIYNSPTAPRNLQPLDVVQRVADAFELEDKIVLNDCGAGAYGEWLLGWKPDEVERLPPVERFKNKPGAYWVVTPDMEKDVKPGQFGRVIYVTISTGENFGFVDENGDLVGRPESGHIFYADRDLFGNEIRCNCGEGGGGLGHYEGCHAGSGFAKVILNGIERGGIPKESLLYRRIEDLKRSEPDRKKLMDAIPMVFYEAVANGDETALDISRWHNTVTAHFIGAILGSGYRPQKLAIGGSMTKDMRYSILPAFQLYIQDARAQKNDYNPNQRLADQPVLAVCKDYGDNHVGLGAAAGLLRKVYGKDVLNYRN